MYWGICNFAYDGKVVWFAAIPTLSVKGKPKESV